MFNYFSKHFPLLVSTTIDRLRPGSTSIGSRLLTRTSGLALSVGCSLQASPRQATSTPPDVDQEDLTLSIIASFPGSSGVETVDRHLGLGYISYLGSRTRLPVGLGLIGLSSISLGYIDPAQGFSHPVVHQIYSKIYSLIMHDYP